MKIILLAALFTLVSCGNDPKEFNGKVYNCYGFMDKDEEKKSEILYEINGANMLGSLVFVETIFVPIWNLGWNTYCPVRLVEKN